MAKTSIDQWDTSAGNNTDVGGINIDEGMAPSDVNNALRALMAQLKSWYDQAHVGQVHWFAHSGPSGNWLECDGSAYDSVTNTQYAPLYARIGTTFGGSGPTDFQVPDLRGRAPMGAGQGDTAEGGGTGTERALGDKAGQETAGHSHSGPSHTHTLPGHTHSFSGTTDGAPNQNNNSTLGPNDAAADGHSHSFSGTTASGGGGDSGEAGTGDTGSTAVETVGPALVLKAYIGY